MRQLIIGIVVIQILFIGLWGYDYAHAEKNWIDQKTGIMVRVSSPEDTITSFFELVTKGNYKEAVKLESENSQKVFPVAMIEAQNAQLALQDAKLAKVFPAMVDRDIAVVGFVRTALFPGNDEPTAIFTVYVVKRNPASFRWEIVQDIREIPEKRVMKMFKNTLALDDQLLKDNSLYTDLSETQQVAIVNQVKGMREWHANAVEEFKLYLKQKAAQAKESKKEAKIKTKEKAKNQKKPTPKVVDEETYADEKEWDNTHGSLN